MIGTLIGIVLVIILIGVVWWAIMTIWPTIAQYVAEPFRTIAYVLLVVILVLVALWVIVQLLGLVGIHVPMLGKLSGAPLVLAWWCPGHASGGFYCTGV